MLTTGYTRKGLHPSYRPGGGRNRITYSCHGRGIDMVNGAYQFLDLVPKGRDEDDFGWSLEWLRRHDQY